MRKGQDDPDLLALLFSLAPEDDSAIANQALRQQFLEAVCAAKHRTTQAAFDRLREALIEKGVVVKKKGHGGSVPRAESTNPDSSTAPADSDFFLNFFPRRNHNLIYLPRPPKPNECKQWR